MSHYLHSKALFITSLACFSLGLQSELLADYSVYHCNTGATNCNACVIENGQYASYFGDLIACSSLGGCSDTACTSPLTGMFFYNESNEQNLNLSLNANVSYSTTSPTYVDFNGGKKRIISFDLDSGYYFVEIGSQFTNSRSNINEGDSPDTSNTYFEPADGVSGAVTIYLSNPYNNFTTTQSGTPTRFVVSGLTLQIKSDSINGVEEIEFQSNGILSVPNGGTLSCDCTIEDNNAYLKGGNTADTALVVGSVWTGINAAYNKDEPGALVLDSGFIKPLANAFGGSGNIILDLECFLQIDNSSALGGGSNILAPRNGTLQFLGDINLPNSISFAISSTAPLYVDPLGWNASLDGVISGGDASIILADTSSIPGTLTLSQGSIPADVALYVNRGTLITSATSLDSYVTVANGGILQMGSSTYNGTFDVRNGSTLLLAGDSQVSGPMILGNNEPSTSIVTIRRKDSIDSSISLQSAAGFIGVLSCAIDTGEVVGVTVYRGLFSGGLDISPAVDVHYVCGPNELGVSGTNSNIYGPIKSEGTYTSGSSPINGATLSIENTTGGDTSSTLVGGNITGNLQIFIKNTGEGTSTVLANGYSITGCLQLELGCTLNLNSSASILTLVNNQAASGSSQIDGNITGSGSVVVDVNTQFGSSTTTYPTNSFGSLTLTSGTLGVYGVAALGGSSPTYIGNGGTIDNKTTTTMTLANPWIFNGGTTTKFQGGGSEIAFAITGSITTGGSGSATIDGNSELTLNPFSLNIITGTSFVTNGTSVTTGVITGSGGLVLGAGTNHSPINDTLIVTAASSYSGIISDGTYGGGIVRIQSAVSLLGENTFSKGLYLDSAGTLTINTAGNLGAGTVYFNTGGLTLPLIGSGKAVTASNPLSFTGGGTTLFHIDSYMELALTGTSAITGSTKTAYLTLEGGGILTIDNSSFESGNTYNVSVTSGALVINSETTTVASFRPFLDDGILKGVQDNLFSLADASYANWKVVPIVSSEPSTMNVVVENGGILTGQGSITTAVVNEGGGINPGYRKIEVFTITDSIAFNSGSTFLVKTNGSSASLLTVGGNATVNSTAAVHIFPEAGIYTSGNYLILTAGNLQGTFGSLTMPAGFFLDATLEYDVLNQIILSISPRSIETGITGANAISVGKALDKVVDWNRTHIDYELPIFGGGGDPLLEDVFASLISLTTEEEMSYALNQLQPAFFKGFTVIQENNIVKVQDALTLRMDSILQGNSCYAFQDAKECCSPNEKRIHTWISGLGDVLAQESNTFAGSPQVGYQGKTYGFATGVDGTFAKFLYAGAMGGYTSSYIKWRGHQGTGNINTGYAGLYLSAIGKMFYGNLSLIGGFSDMSSKRHIEYTGVDLTASGNHSGKQLLSHADTGINFSFGGVTIKPFDAFDYVSQTENSYVEKGAGQWGLSLKKSNAILLRNELGLEVSTCLCFKNMKWVVAPKASWVREVRVKGQSYTASFTEAAPADARFTVTGYFPDRSLFSPGICLTGSMCQDKVSVELNYQGEFTHGYSDHSYGAEVRVNF